MATQGGNHDQHVNAGQQSHKNTDSKTASGKNDQNWNSSTTYDSQAKDLSSGTRGGTHEQHVKAGQQSHKNSH